MAIRASFINRPDNVPFNRYYKTRKGFHAALSRMKNYSFLNAIDDESFTIISPKDVRRFIK